MRAQWLNWNPRDESEKIAAEEDEGTKIKTQKCPWSAGTEVIDHHPSDGSEEVGLESAMQVGSEHTHGLASAKVPQTQREMTEVLRGREQQGGGRYSHCSH